MQAFWWVHFIVISVCHPAVHRHWLLHKGEAQVREQVQMKTRHRIRIWSLSSVVKVKVKLLSHVRLFVTPWTVAYQASPSMGFSRQEYWSGLPFPSPVDLPDPGIKPGSPALQADALPSEPPGKPNGYLAALILIQRKLPRWHSGKESFCQCKDTVDSGLIPRSGRSSGRGNGNSLQYCCLENPMDRGPPSTGLQRVGHD